MYTIDICIFTKPALREIALIFTTYREEKKGVTNNEKNTVI